MTERTFEITLFDHEGMGAIPVPFDPKLVFGKVRAPVLVTVNGYTYRSTIAVMRGTTFVPFRTSHREAAGVDDGETITVRIALDTAPRVVMPPDDLLEALHALPDAWERWQSLSYTHQREYVESILGAKQQATRARRIASTVTALTDSARR